MHSTHLTLQSTGPFHPCLASQTSVVCVVWASRIGKILQIHTKHVSTHTHVCQNQRLNVQQGCTKNANLARFWIDWWLPSVPVSLRWLAAGRRPGSYKACTLQQGLCHFIRQSRSIQKRFVYNDRKLHQNQPTSGCDVRISSATCCIFGNFQHFWTRIFLFGQQVHHFQLTDSEKGYPPFSQIEILYIHELQVFSWIRRRIFPVCCAKGIFPHRESNPGHRRERPGS